MSFGDKSAMQVANRIALYGILSAISLWCAALFQKNHIEAIAIASIALSCTGFFFFILTVRIGLNFKDAINSEQWPSEQIEQIRARLNLKWFRILESEICIGGLFEFLGPYLTHTLRYNDSIAMGFLPLVISLSQIKQTTAPRKPRKPGFDWNSWGRNIANHLDSRSRI